MTTLAQARIRKWVEATPAGYYADPRVGAVLDELRSVTRPAAERAIRLLQAVGDEDALRLELGDDIRQALRARPFADDPMGPAARVIRERRGLAAVAVARHAHRDPATIRAWEDGRKTRLTILDSRHIAEALGVSHLALFRLAFKALEETPISAS